MSRNPIARVVRQIRPQVIPDKRHRQKHDSDAELDNGCPVCGDNHEPDSVPFTCETGDGQ